MAKAFYTYTDDTGADFSFLQDTATASAVGNSGAAVGTPRLPHKLKPRRVSISDRASPATYKHPIVGTPLFAGISFGDSILSGTVVGFDDEINNAHAAY
jgi:hypothetical protein